MTKLKGPISSLNASGTISRCITFLKRHKQNIAEKKPEILDIQSAGQLSWRHMFLKCTALWHALSTAEQAEWESLARVKHMTGYAYWQSQCLKPNPGIYLPLQGGTMSGDIDMAKNRILKLPLPGDSQEPLTLAYYTANIAPYLYNERARVYHSALQNIPNATTTILAFDSDLIDNDAIHDPIINNSRLTCKTPGTYIIIGNVSFEVHAAGHRVLRILLNAPLTRISSIRLPPCDSDTDIEAATIYKLALNDYVQLAVRHSAGVPLQIRSSAEYSPIFMMARIAL